MISSIEQITLKDGQTILVMSHADLVETMRNTLGDEFADLVAQEMTGTDRAHASEIQGYEARHTRERNDCGLLFCCPSGRLRGSKAAPKPTCSS